jgi:hypothetical protein
MMRLQALLLSVLLAGAASPALAQERHVGLKAGANFSALEFEGEAATEYTDRKFGFIGGGFAVFPVSGPLAVQIEALFSQKGAEQSLDEVEVVLTLELDYLDFPVLARFNAPASGTMRLHVFAGPSFGYRMGARSKVSSNQFDFAEGEIVNIEEDVRRFDIGLVAGAGADIGRRLVVDARYAWGLTNAAKDNAEGVALKHRVLSIMAGVRF